MPRKKLLSFFVYLFVLLDVYTRQNKQFNISTSHLIQIERLSSYDVVFKQYENIVAQNYELISKNEEPEVYFFVYKNTENFSLLSLAARCNINYETIATLNSIENSKADIKNKRIILPVICGLFIPVKKGKNSIQIVLQEKYANQSLTNPPSYYKIDGEDFYFLQGLKFSPEERLYFLDSDLGLPLKSDTFWISSQFGQRQNPFSKEIKNHNGIDFACAEGTPVFSVKEGIISTVVKNDKIFGNYIIVSHDEGKLTSVYAHLSRIETEQNKKVKKGEVIGFSGQTGMVTGPHLHFELRQNGKPEDPRLKLNLK